MSSARYLATWVLPAVIGFLLLSGAYALLTPLQTKHIICLIQERQCSPELQAQFVSLQNTPLFTTNYEAAVLTLLNQQQLPYEIGVISKKFPDQLIINLKPDTFLYRLQAPHQPVMTITQERWQKSADQTSALPLIELLEPAAVYYLAPAATSPSSDQPSQKINPELHAIITRNLQLLDMHHITFQKIVIIDQVSSLIVLENGQTAVLEHAQVAENVARLAAILKQNLHTSQADIKEIDVRFDLPVLRSTPSYTLP